MAFMDPPYALIGNSTGVNGVKDCALIHPFFRSLSKVLTHSLKIMGHAYVCCDAYTVSAIYESLDFTAKNLIVWQKSSGGGLGSYYTKIYELIWFFVNEPPLSVTGKRAKDTPKARVINGQPNIWFCSIVQPKDRLHPAQKPLEIVTKAIVNSSDPGETVLDLFGGSGTTLIACEQLGRRCLIMEMNPKYCRVIIDRWEKATGGKAVKEG